VEFYLVNLSSPAKTEKNHVRTRDKSGSNSPPFQCNVQIGPSIMLQELKLNYMLTLKA